MLAFLSVLALVLLICRACIQSITIDEADTYLFFVGRPNPSHWEAASNNHVLNSMLIRLCTMIFGLHNITMRLPALTGACLYIVAAVFLACAITRQGIMRLTTFVLMVFNPFVMDYLVAARGYSLALGFLLSALALCICRDRQELRRGHPYRIPALAAGLLALSFCSNLAFGVINGVAFLGITLWVTLERAYHLNESARRRCILGTLGLMTLVGAFITWFFVGPILLNWPQGELVAGASALKAALRSVIDASVVRPNPYLLNPQLVNILTLLGAVPIWALISLSAVDLALLLAGLRLRKMIKGSVRQLGLLAFFVGILALTIAGHIVLRRVFAVLYPIGRTAIFLAPLAVLTICSAAAIPFTWKLAELVRRCLMAAAVFASLYFLCCLRISYFNEWLFDADADKLYSVLARYNQQCGLRSVSSNWRYVAVLNYYRRQAAASDSIIEIPNAPPETAQYPAGKEGYVIYYPQDEQFIQQHHLVLVYHSTLTDAGIALDPHAVPSCLQLPTSQYW